MSLEIITETGEIVGYDNSDWYEVLVEECKAIITEAVFTSRWALVEGYHHLGERIVNENNLDRKEVYGKKILHDCAKSIGVSDRTLYYAIQFYDKYPRLDMLPEGKNITWSKIKTQYLTAPKKPEIQLPEGQYGIIYADPPWKYSDKLIEGYGAADHHYEQMSIDELCELPVKDMAGDDAVLFIWVTSPLLEDCFQVIEAWGFKYKASFVWDKVKHNYGHYNSVRHEFLLVCTRGSKTPDNTELYDSVQSIERSKVHSEKPEEFRNIIDDLYPSGSRLELFGRKKVDGWRVWGNEAG